METVIEACVETVDEAKKAEMKGAHRLELCAHLDLDGLTPSPELVSQVLSVVGIPVKAMIRPRTGNFIYNEQEIQQMLDEIHILQSLGIKEFVTGILTQEATIDLIRIRQLVDQCPSCVFTFHKAIDHTNDPCEELLKLKSIRQFKYLLTSGQSRSAFEGKEMINKMIRLGGKEITIIAAGKITTQNIIMIRRIVPGCQYHGRKIV